MFGTSKQVFFKFLLLFFIVVYGAAAFSQTKQTLSCSRKNIQTGSVFILNNKSKSSKPHVYFIKNISQKSLWLNHPQNNNPHAGAGWASTLKPRHWSALVLSQEKFIINCAMMNNKKLSSLNCNHVIQVCESNTRVESATGNYWLVENKNWDDFIKQVLMKSKVH